MNNIINTYVEFNRNYLSNICKFVYKKNEEVIDNFINTYINCAFYHELETLDGCKNYGINTIKNELKGKYYELIYENIINKKECTECLEIVLLCINIINANTKKDIYSIINKYSKRKIIQLNKKEIFSIYKMVEDYNNNINKFNDNIKINNYYLINKEMDFANFYTSLGNNIISLNKYNNNLIKSELNSKNIIDKKIALEFDLINLEIIKLVKTKKHINNFFIEFDVEDISDCNKLLEKINHKLSKKIVLVINNNQYLKQKNQITKMAESFSLAVLINFKNINEVSKKLSIYDEDINFDYIIVNGYKDKDYNTISNYKFKYNTKLFIIEEE